MQRNMSKAGLIVSNMSPGTLQKMHIYMKAIHLTENFPNKHIWQQSSLNGVNNVDFHRQIVVLAPFIPLFHSRKNVLSNTAARDAANLTRSDITKLHEDDGF